MIMRILNKMYNLAAILTLSCCSASNADHLTHVGHHHGTATQTSSTTTFLQPAQTSFMQMSVIGLAPVQTSQFFPTTFFVPTPNTIATTSSIDTSNWELKPVSTTQTSMQWVQKSAGSASVITPTGDIDTPKSPSVNKENPAPKGDCQYAAINKRLEALEKNQPKKKTSTEESIDKLTAAIEANNKAADVRIDKLIQALKGDRLPEELKEKGK